MTYAGSPTIGSLDLESGDVRSLTDGQFPRYANGQLLFGTPDGSMLMSAPFDPERMDERN